MFFYTILGSTQSHWALNDIEGFVQVLLGTHKCNRPNIITGIEKVHLKCDCNNLSIVNGIREPILYSFALDKPAGHRVTKKHKVKPFKR